MHYRYEKQSFPAPAHSAHFRYRSAPATLTLFDADDSPRVELDAQSSAARAPFPDIASLKSAHIVLPSFSAFLAAHHRAHDPRTLADSDVDVLVDACTRILHLLADGQWHPITEIRDVARVLSYDRRLRDLRKLSACISGVDYYVHIDARRIADDARTFAYRAHLETFPQTRKAITHE